MSIHMSIHMSMHMFIHVSIHVSIYVYMYRWASLKNSSDDDDVEEMRRYGELAANERARYTSMAHCLIR